MSDPLTITFGLLGSTGNPHSVEPLIAALDAGVPAIETLAVQALGRRGSARGLVEAIRRLETLAPESRAAMSESRAALQQALKQALQHGDRALQSKALEIAVQSNEHEILPLLVAMLEDKRCTLHEEAGHAVVHLAEHLYTQSQAAEPSPTGRPVRNASQARTKALTVFDKACTTFSSLAHPEPIVRSILMLADPEHFAVKRILSQAEAECRDLAGRVLQTSCHPGVMQFCVGSLARNYPYVRAMDAMQKRTDMEFICHVLRSLPAKPTLFEQKNLRQIEQVAWLDGDLELLATIPPGLQPKLVAFVTATGIPTKRKVALQEWIVRNGTPEGRAAASGVLGALEESQVRGIISEGLESLDADVQAWATTQLRTHAVPQGLELLIERLDSPLESVQSAARAELKSFDVHMLLEMCETMDPALCQQAAMLVRKIDPMCVQKLDIELSHPVRRRRIRAAKGAVLMGLHAELAAGLLVMLEDEDPHVRRTAAEVLGEVPSGDVLAALSAHLGDESVRVRETVQKSIKQIKPQIPEDELPSEESMAPPDAKESEEPALAR